MTAYLQEHNVHVLTYRVCWEHWRLFGSSRLQRDTTQVGGFHYSPTVRPSCSQQQPTDKWHLRRAWSVRNVH